MKKKQSQILCLAIMLIFCLSACSEKFSRATQAAIKHPSNWGPLLAATIIAAADKDVEISDWAQRETPVFGSMRSAENASDSLVDSLVISAGVSALFIADHSNGSDMLSTNAETFFVEAIGLSANSVITSGVKSATDRTRPNHYDQRSFPSGHTSKAFAAAKFTEHNIQQLELNDNTKKYFDWIFNSAAYATGWARVESGWHYPADVLAGAAVGGIVASIFTDMYLQNSETVTMDIELSRDTQKVAFSLSF
ncbi:MAG: phosphatase PAP2 family protein [Gammaproteobacteria bacterium]|nr:phosphatase PAP2 family protein [Gammaproteobacteria bacterium]